MKWSGEWRKGRLTKKTDVRHELIQRQVERSGNGGVRCKQWLHWDIVSDIGEKLRGKMTNFESEAAIQRLQNHQNSSGKGKARRIKERIHQTFELALSISPRLGWVILCMFRLTSSSNTLPYANVYILAQLSAPNFNDWLNWL